MKYRINNFEIDTSLFKILRDGVAVPVEPKVFDVLVYLIEMRHQVVSRDTLFDVVWKGRDVSDATLSNHIKSARKALGDNGELQNVITTVRGRGYQFVGVVEELSDSDTSQHTKTDAQAPRQQLAEPRRKRYSTIFILALVVVGILLVSQIIPNATNDESPSRIAVLPFTNLKPDTKTDYISFALADQIIGGLANFEQISVRASGSVRHYQQQILEPAKIGKELNVDHLLMGSYLNETGSLKLTVELIEIKSNKMIWRKTIRGDASNAFFIQSDLVKSVAVNLGFEQADFARSLIAGDVPQSALAYEYYLRAIAFPHTVEGRNMAIKMLLQAEAIDSNFAPIYVELGNRTYFKSVFELGAEVVAEESTEYYKKAIQLNPNSFAAMAGLANHFTERGELAKAIKIVRQTLRLQPNNAEAHFSLSYIYRYAGLGAESIKEMQTALSLDPKENWVHNLGITYLYFGEYQKALAEVGKGKQTAYSLGIHATTYFQLGQKDKVLEYLERSLKMEPGEFWVLDAIAFKSVINEQYDVGLSSVKKYEDANINHGESLFHWAGLAALLGDNEACFRLLRKSVGAGYFNYPHFTNSALFASVREESEFKEILATVKKQHEAFKAEYF